MSDELREGMSTADHLEYCKVLDARLCSLAKRRAALDVEEAELLRAAEEMKLWRVFGHASLLEYMERAMGYQPHTARERLRVAKALAQLPQIEEALAAGRVPHSAVREVAGVANAETEAAWLDAIEGKSCREIEKLVAGHKPGALPTDPTDPDLRTHRLELVLGPQAYAAFRQGRVMVQKELGHQVTDDELIGIIFRRALGAPVADGEVPAQAYVRSIKTCDQCHRHWEVGGGRDIEVSAATAEMADCDAILLGSLDAAVPARTATTLTPRLRRQVFERDGFRCCVPGCRSVVNLDLHHIRFRSDGGTHALDNITVTCGGHHRAVHHGLLRITGSAPHGLEFTWLRKPRSIEMLALDENDAPTFGDGDARPAWDAEARASADRVVGRTFGYDDARPTWDADNGADDNARTGADKDVGPTHGGVDARPTWDADDGDARAGGDKDVGPTCGDGDVRPMCDRDDTAARAAASGSVHGGGDARFM